LVRVDDIRFGMIEAVGIDVHSGSIPSETMGNLGKSAAVL